MVDFDAAFAHLDRQEHRNYAEAAKIYGISSTQLMRRYTGQCVSRQQATSEHRQLLNDTQEDTLLRYIDELTNRSIPATTQIVKNLAEEILKRPVGKNWPAQFVKRYSNRICSVYLNRIDKNRASAASAAVFERYYAIVLSNFALWSAFLLISL